VLELLSGQPEPLSQAAIVDATGLHANTIREHLEGLRRRGLVRRLRAEPSGRGRPAWLYEATDDDATGSEYAGLASVLAATIARTSDEPERAAATAGEEWGHELAHDRGALPVRAETARRHVIHLLDELGFEPEEAGGHVRLTRCPLLEAAHRYPEVVCAVHLGIVRGALEEYGADPAGSELTPFAEPGACRLVVPPLDGSGA
jgi:predicted ArsR family transcriptional regulator